MQNLLNDDTFRGTEVKNVENRIVMKQSGECLVTNEILLIIMLHNESIRAYSTKGFQCPYLSGYIANCWLKISSRSDLFSMHSW